MGTTSLRFACWGFELWCHMSLLAYLVQLLSTISPARVIREEFSWHYQYICKQTDDEKQEEYQLRDTFWFILVIELSGVQFGVQV